MILHRKERVQSAAEFDREQIYESSKLIPQWIRMFWLILSAPYALVLLAALVAKKGSLTKLAIVLVAMFAALDGYGLWDVMGENRSSTGGLGLVVIGLIESIVALAFLVAAFMARRGKEVRNDRNAVN